MRPQAQRLFTETQESPRSTPCHTDRSPGAAPDSHHSQRQGRLLIFSGCPGHGRRHCRSFEEGSQDLPCQLHQRWHVQRANSRVLRQVQLSEFHRQGVPAHGFYDQRQEKVRSGQDARFGPGCAQAAQGILHPNGKQQHPLPAIQALRRRRQRLRDRLIGDLGNSILARPSRHFARLCRPSRRRRQAHLHRAQHLGVLAVLHRLQLLRQ